MVSSRMLALMMAVLMIGIATRVAEGQSTPPSCASKLVPCANYINSTSPPSSCCDPLKEAVTKELDCLCKLYANPSVLKSFGINATEALLLPQHCGIPGNISTCNAMAPGSSTSPPGTPGNGPNNAVGKTAWSGLSSLLLLWASVMLC